MKKTSALQRTLRQMLLCLSSALLFGLWTAPWPASAEPLAVTAKSVQRQVAAIDAKFKQKKPDLIRYFDTGAENDDEVLAWGTAAEIEKISVKYQGERGEFRKVFYWQQGMLVAVRKRQIDYGSYVLPKEQTRRRWKVVLDDQSEFAGEVVLSRRSYGKAMPTEDANGRSESAELKADARSYKRLMDLPKTKEETRESNFWTCVREEKNEEVRECLEYKRK